jgi:hypothetical protein
VDADTHDVSLTSLQHHSVGGKSRWNSAIAKSGVILGSAWCQRTFVGRITPKPFPFRLSFPVFSQDRRLPHAPNRRRTPWRTGNLGA